MPEPFRFRDPELRQLRYEGYKGNFVNGEISQRQFLEGMARCGFTELEAKQELEQLKCQQAGKTCCGS